MPIEIQNPKTSEFIPLLGASGFDTGKGTFSFYMDWTRAGPGQELLREHIRTNAAPLRMKASGREYGGTVELSPGMNGPNVLTMAVSL